MRLEPGDLLVGTGYVRLVVSKRNEYFCHSILLVAGCEPEMRVISDDPTEDGWCDPNTGETMRVLRLGSRTW